MHTVDEHPLPLCTPAYHRTIQSIAHRILQPVDGNPPLQKGGVQTRWREGDRKWEGESSLEAMSEG